MKARFEKSVRPQPGDDCSRLPIKMLYKEQTMNYKKRLDQVFVLFSALTLMRRMP